MNKPAVKHLFLFHGKNSPILFSLIDLLLSAKHFELNKN